MNTTTAVEQSANFGLRTLPGLFGLQNEAFERLQKLTHLNLAAFETMMEEGQSALSPQQSGLPPVAGAVGLSQRFTEHAVSYSTHVREIDSQFMTAIARAGEDLRNQYTAMWIKAATSFGQKTAPFSVGRWLYGDAVCVRRDDASPTDDARNHRSGGGYPDARHTSN